MRLSWKKRDPKSHKGQNGRVLVIGGSESFVGAPALAGMAALRAGCDWVTIAAPEKAAWTINSFSPDLITVKLPGKALSQNHLSQLLIEAEKHGAVILGNGVGLDTRTKAAVKALVKEIKTPLVLDADALKIVKIQDCSDIVFTPHKREFEMLLESSRLKEENLQSELGTNVMLEKGPLDRIISKSRILTNTTGNPGMTKAGTGDVLAGITASLIAQDYALFDSAYMAANINGLVGDSLLPYYGYGYSAWDMVNHIAHVLQEVGAWQ